MTAVDLRDWYRSTAVRPEDASIVAKMVERGEVSNVRGGAVARFERRFARFAGGKHAIACCNGTGAIQAGLWAVGVRPGREVAVCDYGFFGMAAAVLALGADLVPVDCRADSLTMDPDDLLLAVSDRTAAVLVHNPWGAPADLATLRDASPVPVVLDTSHAHGARFGGDSLVTHADVACYSLGRGKLMTGGELGVLVTDDPAIHDRVLVYGLPGRPPADLVGAVEWEGTAVGPKLRPHALACALAAAQLGRIDERLSRIDATARSLVEAFAPGGFLPPRLPDGADRVWWKIVLRIDDEVWGGTPAEWIEEALRERQIPVEKNHYVPLLQDHSIFDWPDHRDRVRRRECPTCRAVAPRTITLPAPEELDDAEVERVRRVVAEVAALATG